MDRKRDNLYVALIHYPVLNKQQETIGSAVTNIDLHDIARASRTFGVRGYYVVTPYEDQQKLTRQITEHWTRGGGGKRNPDRKAALELIRVVNSFEEVVQDIKNERNQPVVTVGTSAKPGQQPLSTAAFQKELDTNASHVILFGTAWGLAAELMEACDLQLEPIKGAGDYNHLSVRSAASIYLDRITNG